MVLHEVADELPLCGIASSEGLGLKKRRNPLLLGVLPDSRRAVF